MGNKSLVVQVEGGRSDSVLIDKNPDYCPVCHEKLQPINKFAYFNDKEVQVIFLCPNDDCRQLFVSYYKKQWIHASKFTEAFYFQRSLPWTFIEADIPKDIREFSRMFVKILNEAQEAEHRGLCEICGAGYRRALEFLVKDYLINVLKLDHKLIEDAPLGLCIKDHIDDKRIKACARRAAKLGNDQTHYFQKWEDKDLSDLKILIELTVGWIHSECLTNKYQSEMPEEELKKK